ncbi:hypothetical protein [Arthrobacter sp.]|uniref:hypothetical protein n=1 Tax=Arthrobacter sp. TaxID=1667 RepID=UPI003A8D95C2
MTELLAGPSDTAIYQPGEPFTAPELAVLRAEGALRIVLPGAYVCAARPDTAEVRTAAVASFLGPRLREAAVIGRLTAAWVHGCHPLPAELELLVARFHRLPLRRGDLGISLHECVLGDDDVLRIGRMQVTTPVRTALDVAFHAPPGPARRVLARMLGTGRIACNREELVAAIEATGRRPGKRAALDLVHGLPHLAAVP